MPSVDTSPSEQLILRACVQGEISLEDAFYDLYMLYAPIVRGWLLVSVKRAEADDLFQDIWIIFYRRWQQWQFLPEMEDAEARPIASFLYRTFRFALEGHRRRMMKSPQSIEGMEIQDHAQGSEQLLRQVELGHCLDLARRICSPQELDILLAKLAGIPARDIAQTLSVSESVVDHRFRHVISCLQKRLARTRKP